jgi:hypothetical protein
MEPEKKVLLSFFILIYEPRAHSALCRNVFKPEFSGRVILPPVWLPKNAITPERIIRHHFNVGYENFSKIFS